MGYAISFGFTFVIYLLIGKRLERWTNETVSGAWITYVQIACTGVLWASWLTQNNINFGIFMPI